MKLIIHLGYPKTGSTFLNNNLFIKHSQINLITKNAEINSYINSIKYLDDIEYDKKQLTIRNFFNSKISNEKIDNESSAEVSKLGKEMLSDPGQVLPDVKSTLKFLSKSYILILIIKETF